MVSGFDPMVPFNWYSVSKQDILEHRGGRIFLSQYEGDTNTFSFSSYPKAIMAAYPAIKFNNELFMYTVNENSWESTKKRRHFFDMYAHQEGFDPLATRNWLAITYRDFLKAGGAGLVFWHKRSFVQALQELYGDSIVHHPLPL